MLLQPKKPIIFLAFANVRDDSLDYLRNLPDEQRQIREALERARIAGLCEIVERPNTTTKEILDVFQHAEYRNRIAIFHYGGHANGLQLLLESPEGKASPAYAGGFAQFLGQQTGLQLVFLNGCSTEPQVQGLLRANVSAVIATSHAIIDDIATKLAVRFYAGLAGGANIRTAYNEAVASIRTEIGDDLLNYYLEATTGENRFPWDIYLKQGAELTDQWNLPNAAGDPLFGLPPIPPGDLPDKPFRHLHWFAREHAEIFFGRGHQIRELYDRVTSPHSAPIILLYGQSGVGKSSLLAAGLMPRLECSFEIRYCRWVQEIGLLGTLQEALAISLKEGAIGNAWLSLEDQLKRPVLVILDQVEEVFTRPNKGQPREFQQFLDALKEIFVDVNKRPNGKLILSFRKEWLAEIEKRLREHKLARNLIFLERLDRRGIMEATAMPAQSKRLQEQYRMKIEDGLPEIIADDLLEDRDSPIAPTLQILLTRMWEQAIKQDYDHPHFTIDLYQGLKKQGILLKDFLEQQLEQLRQWQPEIVDSGLALDVLAFHTTPLGTAEQRTHEQLEQNYSHRQDILPALIQKCKDLYLLVDPAQQQGQQRSDGVTRLAHDTLAPLIRQQFDESDKPGQRAVRILMTKMRDFDEHNDRIWLDATDLETVENGLRGMRILSDHENKLLGISHQKRTRSKRIRKIIWSTGSVMILLIILFAVFAWISMKKENRQAKRAKVNYLINLAEQFSKTDKTKAIRIAQAVYDLAPKNPPIHPLRLMHNIYYDQVIRCFYMNFKHDGEVNSAVFSPDGSKIVTTSGDITAKLWTAAGESLAVFKPNYKINSAVFSPDGSKVLTTSRDSTAKLWTVAGEPIAVFKHDHWVKSAIFSPDGSKILTASRDNTAKLWTIAGESLAVFRHNNDVFSAVFSPDGSKILTASIDQMAKLWTITGDYLAVFKHDTGVQSAVFSPDASKILCTLVNGSAKLLTIAGDALAIFKHNNAVSSSVFSPDGSKILTASVDGTAKLWTEAGDSLAVFNHDLGVISAVFSPDGSKILTASGDRTAKLWTIGGDCLAVLKHDYDINSAVFSPDGSKILTASDDNTAKLWTIVDDSRAVFKHDAAVSSAVFSPDGSKILTASLDSTARLWTIVDDSHAVFKHDAAVNSAVFSPDSRQILTASNDNKAKLWTVAGDSLAVFKHDHWITSAVFSPEGSKILTGSADRTAKLWTIAGDALAVFKHDGWVHSIVFSPDGKKILTVSLFDKTAKLWTVAGDFLEDYKHNLSVFSAVFSPDGSMILTASHDKTAKLWKLFGDSLAIFNHDDVVNSAVFSPDGSRILTASLDNTAKLWTVAGGPPAIFNHNNRVNSAVFSPDGSKILTTSGDKTAKLWTVAGDLLAVFNHNDFVTSAVFSPDGSRILTASWDGTARMWLTPEGIYEWLKTAPIYQLSEQEKKEYGILE